MVATTDPTDAMMLTGRLAAGDRTGYSEFCPIERALDTIGTRSALVLLREAFWGTRRFEDFANRAGITEQMAAKRLKQLVDAGVLTKQPYRTPGQRTRYEYVMRQSYLNTMIWMSLDPRDGLSSQPIAGVRSPAR